MSYKETDGTTSATECKRVVYWLEGAVIIYRVGCKSRKCCHLKCAPSVIMDMHGGGTTEKYMVQGSEKFFSPALPPQDPP